MDALSIVASISQLISLLSEVREAPGRPNISLARLQYLKTMLEKILPDLLDRKGLQENTMEDISITIRELEATIETNINTSRSFKNVFKRNRDTQISKAIDRLAEDISLLHDVYQEYVNNLSIN